jgi:hypothetical protein
MATNATVAIKVTYETLNPGNSAIQTEIWTIPVSVGKKLVRRMKAAGVITPGGYWKENLVKPLNRAVRTKKKSFEVRTAGFSTSELNGWLQEIT